MPRYSLHGLCVQSQTPLVAVPADPAREPDLCIEPWEVGPERFDALVQIVETAPRLIDRAYSVTSDAPALRSISAEHDATWLTLFFDRVLFQLHRESRRLHRFVRTDDDIAFGDMLMAGSYWATLCTLRDRAAHHCSAIDVASLGGTVLVAARSGQGKSSTAASLVLAGGRLRSDDVVTLVAGAAADDRFQCESGSLALRMRKPIEAVLPDTLRAHEEASGDQRHLYFGTAAIPERSPVVAVLFSQLETDATSITLEPLPALDGFRRLAQEPRVGGVKDRAYQAARVAELTALCGRTPLFLARMPMPQRDLRVQGAKLIELLQGAIGREPA